MQKDIDELCISIKLMLSNWSAVLNLAKTNQKSFFLLKDQFFLTSK